MLDTNAEITAQFGQSEKPQVPDTRTPNTHYEADAHTRLQAARIVRDLVSAAKALKLQHGRELPVYGALGELFAVAKLGVQLHNDACKEGSDGRLGKDFVEVKTISPFKNDHSVQVKKAGNWGVLVIVRVYEDFTMDCRAIRRKKLGKTDGDMFTVPWCA